MPTITVQLPPPDQRRYEVVIARGVLGELGARARGVAGGSTQSGRAFIVADAGLPQNRINEARDQLQGAGFDVTLEAITPTEHGKTLDTAAYLLDRLAASRHERRDPVIAIGGGIVGDVAGFAASIYRRGVPVIQCPTTLLSMVDASVGGKTGVNIAISAEVRGLETRATIDLRKNMVGCFWQPALVLADISALDSLPERHLRAGVAECLKHGLISHASDADLFAWTRAALPSILGRHAAALEELIARNVRVKASFVEDDEREERPSEVGGRALLNLGHTFGHAIETIDHLTPTSNPADAPLHHGEAIALGLIAAAATSHALGLLSGEHAASIRAAVEAAGLPARVAGLPPDDEILASMAHDKKVIGGTLRLVLPVGRARFGESRVIDGPPIEAVRAGLAAIRA